MQSLYKHVKNFVSSDANDKKFTQGIYFDGEAAVVTNGSVLIKIDNVPSEKKLIHWKTGQNIDAIYPDYKKVIPTQFKVEFELPIAETLKALKPALLIASKPRSAISLKIVNQVLVLSTQNENAKYESTIFCKFDRDIEKFEEIAFDGKRLFDLLMFFKDSSFVSVHCGLNGKLSPMLLKAPGRLAVLMPIKL